MAVDMFMKIPGADGESKGTGHTAEIDVLAWSWWPQPERDNAHGDRRRRG